VDERQFRVVWSSSLICTDVSHTVLPSFSAHPEDNCSQKQTYFMK